MKKTFPRTTVAGVSLSRMIIGTNWILGYSHTSPAADHFIKQKMDIEISLAALENRPPDLEGRNSPNKTDVMK